MILNVETLGQVFTPPFIVDEMIGLIKNSGSILEPSCGDGAFLKYLPERTLGIELDTRLVNNNFNINKNYNIINADFFSYSVENKFETIIGNPPYVRYQDISEKTKNYLRNFEQIFDKRTNLYLFFIYKSILHLSDNGELIFITPRDFLKSTSAMKLNEFIYEQGTITDFIDLGDKKIFKDAQPNCAIWRFEKNNHKKITNITKQFNCINGQLLFVNNNYSIKFSDLFFVKVGAVSGKDEIFTSDKYGNQDFVCSSTYKTGKTKKMLYNQKHEYLEKYKNILLNRKIKKFDETSWYRWGRDYYKSSLPRIYVNCKTRNKKPFFIHECKAYDGSVLAIFLKNNNINTQVNIQETCDKLNKIDWEELGFICDGRFLFSQKSLENCLLPEDFHK